MALLYPQNLGQLHYMKGLQTFRERWLKEQNVMILNCLGKHNVDKIAKKFPS